VEQDPYLEEDEVMRDEKHYANKYGDRIEYVIGPNKTQALKIADILRREGDREGVTDKLKLEEGLMRALAGQEAHARVCMDGLPKKLKDMAVRRKPHMAVGPVYTKANELDMHIRLLTKVGGSPGADWGAVAELSNFAGAVVKVISRGGSKKPMAEKEGLRWIRQMQAALAEDEPGDAMAVWVNWKDHLKHVAPTEERVAAVDMEADLKAQSAELYGSRKQLFRKGK